MIDRLLRKARHTAKDLLYEVQTLRRHYPAFVSAAGGRLAAGEVPVFTYHTIEPDSFEADLRHLQRNGYHAIDCTALCRHLRGEATARPGAVVLTIDDGRQSVWTYGVPLLQRYGFTATVFLIPGYVRDEPAPGPSLADVWTGRCRQACLPNADPALMTWAEIRAAQASGVIDCQSHTCFHHRVPIGAAVESFLSPSTTDALFDLAVPEAAQEPLRTGGSADLLGLPIYPNATLMSARPRFHPEPAVLEACLAPVRAAGGAAFFDRRGALDDLARIHAEAVAGHGAGRLETAAEAAVAVRRDLEQSRRLIETALDGKPCTHLCYPYTEGSAEAVRLSADAGFESNFWGILPGRPINRPGDDPMHIVRLKSDYIARLPGEGRKPLAAIIGAKLRRRLAGRPVY